MSDNMTDIISDHLSGKDMRDPRDIRIAELEARNAELEGVVERYVSLCDPVALGALRSLLPENTDRIEGYEQAVVWQFWKFLSQHTTEAETALAARGKGVG